MPSRGQTAQPKLMLRPSSASAAVSRLQTARTASVPGAEVMTRELVAADAGDAVLGGEIAGEDIADSAQEVVAHRVALVVVDLAEVVDVAEDQAERAAELGLRRERRRRRRVC